MEAIYRKIYKPCSTESLVLPGKLTSVSIIIRSDYWLIYSVKKIIPNVPIEYLLLGVWFSRSFSGFSDLLCFGLFSLVCCFPVLIGIFCL